MNKTISNCVFVFLFLFFTQAFADLDNIKENKLSDRISNLTNQLRCLVCQNQSLAESEAPLAVDLKKQVKNMVEQGRTDLEIREYMVARYGDFILYEPPLNIKTVLLWWGPFLFLIGMILMIKNIITKKNSTNLKNRFSPLDVLEAREKLEKNNESKR